MAETGVIQKTVYIVRLSPEDKNLLQEDFLAYPFPDWQIEELEVGDMLPIPLLSGHAAIILGCGEPAGCADSIWLLRLFLCGCPWIAIGIGPDRPTEEMARSASAVAYLEHPFGAAKLRELLWHAAIPQMGKVSLKPLRCDRLIRYLGVMRGEVLLKFTTEAGRTAYLDLKNGQPVHASILGGSHGEDAFRQILDWPKGKVLGLQPLENLTPNLPNQPESWLNLFRMPTVAPAATPQDLSGGSQLCDRIAQAFDQLQTCALVDIPSGRVIARPSEAPVLELAEVNDIHALMDLLRFPYALPGTNAPTETAQELLFRGHDDWITVMRLGASQIALVILCSGMLQLELGREVVAEIARELEQRVGMVIETAQTGS